jgi:hypothetical protein
MVKSMGVLWSTSLISSLLLGALACGNSSTTSSSTPATSPNVTGNKSFDVATYKASDPLAKYRTSITFGSNKPRFKATLPGNVNHGNFVPNAANQGQTGSCSSWSAAYYKSWQEAMEEGWDVKAYMFSPMFLFSMQCRHHAKFGSDAPYSDDLSAAIMKAYGAVLETDLPYKDYGFGAEPNAENDAKEKAAYAGHTISDEVLKKALNYKAGEKYSDFFYYDETSSSWKLKFDALKEMVSKQPVMLGIANFEGPKSSSPEENFFYPKSGATGHGGGHAIICIGYDDTKFGTGAWLTRNSWGQDSGEKGDTWIKYTDQVSVITGAMTIKDLPNTNSAKKVEAAPLAPTGVTATSNKPEVTVTWTKVSDARSYKIYRKLKTGTSSYAFAGKADINSFVDRPNAGTYLYLVTAVNARGESKFQASDDAKAAYVAEGKADVSTIPLTIKPTLALTTSSANTAKIGVTGLDSYVGSSNAIMNVLLASDKQGPWVNMGDIKIISSSNIEINWGARNEFVGIAPYIKMSVQNTDGQVGPFSNILQVPKIKADPTILGAEVKLATISDNLVMASVDSTGNVTLTWQPSATGNVEFYSVSVLEKDPETGLTEEFEIDQVQAVTSGNVTVIDNQATPGYSLMYSVTPVFAGMAGDNILSNAVTVPVTVGNALEILGFTSHVDTTTHVASFSNIMLYNMGDTEIVAGNIEIKVLAYSSSLSELEEDDSASSANTSTEETSSDNARTVTDFNGYFTGSNILAFDKQTYSFSIDLPEEFRSSANIYFFELQVVELGEAAAEASFAVDTVPYTYDLTFSLDEFTLSETYDDGDGEEDIFSDWDGIEVEEVLSSLEASESLKP